MILSRRDASLKHGAETNEVQGLLEWYAGRTHIRRYRNQCGWRIIPDGILDKVYICLP